MALAGVLAASAARAADGVAGTWVGEYDCAQGQTGLTLIVSPGPRARMRTLFYFYPTAENPDVPRGCFEMSGSFDENTRQARFTAGRWLLRPPGFVTVDLLGALNMDATALAGDVDGPGCDTFDLHRADTPPRALPAACGAVPDVEAMLTR